MEFKYQPNNFLATMKEFAFLLGKTVSEDGVLNLPESLAQGFVRTGSSEKDLPYILSRAKINETVTLQRITPPGQPGYLLIYLEAFSPNNISIKDTDEQLVTGMEKMHTIFFTAMELPRAITFTVGSIVKFIAIQIGHPYLRAIYNSQQLEKIRLAGQTPLPSQLDHRMQNDSTSIVNDIFDLEHYHPIFINTQENRIHILTDQFFKSLFQNEFDH